MPEFHSTHHAPTARQKAKAKRVRRVKAVNNREATFGKIHWNCYEHRELWDMVQSANLSTLGGQADQWTGLARNVRETTEDVDQLVRKLLQSWRGPSAAQAADSVQQLTAWAATAGEHAEHIGAGLSTYTSAIDEAQRRMPEPVHYWAERWFKQGYAVKRLDGPEGAYMLDELLDDKLPTKQEADDAKAAAVRVMEQYESASHDVRHRLPPAFDTAPQVSTVTADSVAPEPPGGPPVVDHDPGFEPDPGIERDPGPGGDPGGPGRVPGDSTSTASALPPTFTGAGLPGGLDGVIGAAGPGGPGPGAPGYGTGVGPGFAALPGSGVPGAPGEGARAGTGRFGTGAAGFGPGAPGGRGAAGGYGMYPPGQGPRREEDTEHRDKYAKGYDLLDDLPPAYPPVFGE
jgi:hypothetical protein